MAQRYKLSADKEPTIFKSVARIAEYYIRASKYIKRYMIDFTEEIVYKKNTVKIPDSYSTSEDDYLILTISEYNLQEPIEKNIPCSKLKLECHIDKNGTVLGIYLVV